MGEEKEVSVVLPCLNEEATIGLCIKKAQKVFQEHNIDGEVVVVDNGSTDDTVKIIKSFDVVLAHEPKKARVMLI